MANVKLDPARLVQDGDELYRIARTLDSAVSTLVSSLSGSSGMAGDDNAAEEFCQGSDGYDALAGPTIDGVTSFGNGLRLVDAALSNTARAYDGAQKPGAGLDPATASPAEATATIDESKASVPSALGAGWPGPLGEFQELLEWGLAQIGVVIPTGDEDKLQSASDAWGAFGDSIQSARSQVASSMPNVSAMTLPQQGKMLSCRTSLATGLDRMRESADGMQQWISDFRTQLRNMREELGWFLKQMAIEIAAELAIGGLLTVVTAGLGALATAAKVGTTVIRWCVKIAKLIDRLKDFLRGIRGIKGALIRGGLRAAKEGLQAGLASAIATTSVNAMRADEKGYTPQDVGTAFISAFAGGAAASPVSRVLGGSGGPGVRAGTRQVAGETGAGAVDGLVSSAAESGLTGQEFNPISGMVLGALLGGGLSAGGRGINAVRPGNGSNANAPGSGVNTPVDGPTPGGGAGSGSNNAGAGTMVDTDSSGIPTPGTGSGGSTTTGDGSGPNTSVDAPTTGGGTSDAGGPASPDASAPSSPDPSSPTGPDATAPSSPDASAPASPSPDASAPASPSPDATAPASPDATAPASPDATAPASPDAAPASPDATAPASPDAAPASPEATAPAAPEAAPTSQQDVPVAAASGGSSSSTSSNTNTSTNTSATDADADAPASETSDPEAATDPESTSPEASDSEEGDDVAVEDVAAVGGAAVAAGVAAMLGKPSFLPTHTPGGATPSAPAGPGPGASAPSTPGTTTPGGSAPVAPAAPGSGSGDGSDHGSNPDGANDGDQPDTTQSNRTERTIDEIDQALADINPNYDPSDPANGYATNCGNTSSILNDFLNGQPASEAPTGTLDVPQMEARTGNPQTPMTPEQIDATLRQLGAGSHCVVGIDRSTGDGHWFNAYFDGTTVWSIDAQTGTRSPWPPNEPNATAWDASIHPEHVAPEPASPTADSSASSSSAPAGPFSPASPDSSASDANEKSSAEPESAADREASSRWVGQSTVHSDHASDGSAGAGTTFNGYDIPESTPEVRQQLDALAARDDSPIVRNDDGSYSLAEPIDVESFNLTNDAHDWAEFQRQVGLQQQGLNQLTIAEWQHNVSFYDSHNRVAQAEQAAANRALQAAGVDMSGQAVLHGPDQVAGGRADRFDGAGSFGINSSLGNQWRHRIDDLRFDVLDAVSDIPASLRPHIHLNVELGATNVRDGGPAASQATLTSAQAVGSGANSPTAPGTSRASTVPAEPTGPDSVRDATADGNGELIDVAQGRTAAAHPSPSEHSTPEQPAQGEAAPDPGTTSQPASVDALAGICRIEGHGASQAAIDQARVQGLELYSGISAENRALMEADPVTIDVIPHDKKLTDLAPYAHLAGLHTFDGRAWEDVRGIQTEVNGRRRVAIAEEGLTSIPGIAPGYGPGFLAAHEGGHALQFSGLTSDQATELTRIYAARIASSGSISPTAPPSPATAMWLEPAWYSAANQEEYFANSVAAYLGHPYSNDSWSVTQYTRSWLEQNDPGMFALLQQIYGTEGTA